MFVTFCVEQAFFEPVREGMNEAARITGVNAQMRGVEGVDDDKQIAIALSAIDERFDGVALNMPRMEGFDEAVDALISAGIPVVGFNDDVRGERDHRLAHVSQKLFEAGEALGRRALKRIPEGGRVLITMHSRDVMALEKRREGICRALEAKRAQVSTVYSTTEPTQCRDAILEALRADKDICAVLATGQADTEGAGLAARELSKPPYVCGFDLSDGIRAGIAHGYIDFTVEQQPFLQGFYPAIMLYNYIKRGLYPTDIDAGAIFVDRATLCKGDPR